MDLSFEDNATISVKLLEDLQITSWVGFGVCASFLLPFCLLGVFLLFYFLCCSGVCDRCRFRECKKLKRRWREQRFKNVSGARFSILFNQVFIGTLSLVIALSFQNHEYAFKKENANVCAKWGISFHFFLTLVILHVPCMSILAIFESWIVKGVSQNTRSDVLERFSILFEIVMYAIFAIVFGILFSLPFMIGATFGASGAMCWLVHKEHQFYFFYLYAVVALSTVIIIWTAFLVYTIVSHMKIRVSPESLPLTQYEIAFSSEEFPDKQGDQHQKTKKQKRRSVLNNLDEEIKNTTRSSVKQLWNSFFQFFFTNASFVLCWIPPTVAGIINSYQGFLPEFYFILICCVAIHSVLNFPGYFGLVDIPNTCSRIASKLRKKGSTRKTNSEPLV